MESRRVGDLRAAAFFASSLFFKSNDCRVSSADYLRHQEIEIDLRIGKRLCDRMSQPRLVIPLNEKSWNGGRLESKLVDGRLSVTEGHQIAHRVKDAILLNEPQIAEVLIHVEPAPETLTSSVHS